MIKGWYPNLNSAVMTWAKPTMVFIAAKKLHDYKTIESYISKTVNIFRVPTGQQLEMKPEGQRAWNTETLYTDNSLNLGVDDIIYFEILESERFRIVNKTDWNQFGYIEYKIMSDYK